MSLELVTVRSITRGKGRKEFTYRGVGKITPRNLLDTASWPLVIGPDGEFITYTEKITKEGKESVEFKQGNAYGFELAKETTKDSEGNVIQRKGDVILSEGFRFVTVDDVDVAGIVTSESLQDVLDLHTGDMKALLTNAVHGFNLMARDNAAPVSEAADKEDELSPLVAVLVDNDIVERKDVGNWRRAVSVGAGALEMDRLQFAQMTKEYKTAKSRGLIS